MSSKSLFHDSGVSEHIANIIEGLNGRDKDAVTRQYIPDIAELNILDDEDSDPIGDNVHSPAKGIVHRYPDRVLFKVSNICDTYCRYCFRREIIGPKSEYLSNEDFKGAIEYIKSHNEIFEVILTGGDPLILSARKLQNIFDELDKIEHIKVIRVHTRIPVSNPSKIDDTMCFVLKSVSKSVHVVLHVNHVVEINDTVEGIILKLREADCSVLSQSVLLKGVNDDVKILEKLFKKLVMVHVTPYYLHHLDRAKGTSHFRVSIKRGQKIMKELHGRVSGICLPKYMLDIPHGYGKIPINGSYIQEIENGKYDVEDYQGCAHVYLDEDR